MKKAYFSLRRRTIVTPIWLAALALALVVGGSTWLWNVADSTVLVIVPSAARLAPLFAGGAAPGRIEAIYAVDTGRARRSALSLAAQLRLPVRIARGGPTSIVRDALRAHHGERVLIVANRAAIPVLIGAAGDDLRAPAAGGIGDGTIYVIGVPRIGRPNILQLAIDTRNAQ